MPEPLPAYRGDEPYVFVSYSHADEKAVYAEIRWLQDQGVNVWFDTTGVHPGNEWSDDIADYIQRCDWFLYVVTPRSVEAEYCRRELSFAIEEGCRVIAVHLEDTDVPRGIRLILNNRQAILKSKLGHGYRDAIVRALGERTSLDEHVHRSATEPKRSLRWSQVAVVALIVVVLGAWLALERVDDSGGGVPIRTVAILPLANISGDLSQEYVADGITVELTQVMGRIRSIKVISSQSTRQYKGTEKTASQIGEELGVEGVIGGSVMKAGGRIRVALELVDARTDLAVWAGAFERDLADVLNVQQEIASTVAEQIRVELTEEETAGLATDRTVNPAAYDAFLLAQLTSDRNEAIALLELAVKEDPEFVGAWAGLAEATTIRAWSGLGNAGLLPQAEADKLMARGRVAAEEALQLDDLSSKAHMAMGLVLRLELDFQESGREYRRAIELNPSDTDALRSYSYHLRNTAGKFAEATALGRRIVELEPEDPRAWRDYADHLVVTRHYEEGLEELLQSGFSDPELAARAYWGLDRHRAWLDHQILFGKRFGDVYDDLIASLETSWESEGAKGAFEAWQHYFVEDGNVARFVVMASAWLGDVETAVVWLERGLANLEPNFGDMRAHHIFDPIRTEPKVRELFRRIGYPEWDPDPGLTADTGRALALMGRHAEAEPLLTGAIEAHPGDQRRPRWLVSMGLLRFAKGDYANAAAKARDALALNPRRYTTEDAYLLLASSQGHLNEIAVRGFVARSILDIVSRYELPDLGLRELMLRWHQESQRTKMDFEEASKALQSALRDWPDFELRDVPLPPFTQPDVRQRYERGLFKAGLAVTPAVKAPQPH